MTAAGAAGRPSKAQRRGGVPDRPAAVYPPGAPPDRGRSPANHLAMVVVAVIAFAVVAWFLAGAVFAALRVLELLVVAGLAGWVGYRLGVYRGRHRDP